MKIDQFPHMIVLANPKLKFKEFDEDLNLNLDSFQKSFKTWTTKKDPAMLKQLEARSRVIAQHIINYFVEEDKPADPEPAPADPSPADDPIPPQDPPVEPPVPPAPPEKPLPKNEQALKNLFDKGSLEKITVEMLRKEGFDTGLKTPLGMKGCRVGSYELVRSGANHYKLIKHE
jgi:hypothetical protein